MTEETQLPETTMLADHLAALPKLRELKRPAGQADHYRFFANPATNQHWKVKVEVKPTGPAAVDASVPVAPAGLAVTVTVSPVDGKGKALREDELPVVIDSHTHSFNAVEMGTADFDPEARVMQIVAERIAAGEARMSGVQAIKGLAERWGSGA